MAFLSQRITATSHKNYGMYARAAAITDRDLIHLELGMPVHDTPHFIKQAAIDALLAGQVHYSHFAGLPELRAALADKIARFNGLDVTSDQVLVTNGLTQASFAAFMATVDQGDEVILLDPYYPQHVGKVEICGGVVVTAPLDADDGFALRADWIEGKVTQRTKAIVLVNPCNPTGRVYTAEELTALAQVAIRNDLLVIADEVYEYITFDNQRHISIASLPGMAERTITLSAFTKAYAMDGWRIGYAYGPADLIAAMVKITTNEMTHVNTFIQAGALAAVRDGAQAVAEMVADDDAKRAIVVRAARNMAGVTCAAPQGSIYAFLDIRGTDVSSQDLADRLLDTCDVVVEAGSFYGPNGEGFLRVCFGSQPADRIEEAMARMTRFFAETAAVAV